MARRRAGTSSASRRTGSGPPRISCRSGPARSPTRGPAIPSFSCLRRRSRAPMTSGARAPSRCTPRSSRRHRTLTATVGARGSSVASGAEGARPSVWPSRCSWRALDWPFLSCPHRPRTRLLRGRARRVWPRRPRPSRGSRSGRAHPASRPEAIASRRSARIVGPGPSQVDARQPPLLAGPRDWRRRLRLPQQPPPPHTGLRGPRMLQLLTAPPTTDLSRPAPPVRSP